MERASTRPPYWLLQSQFASVQRLSRPISSLTKRKRAPAVEGVVVGAVGAVVVAAAVGRVAALGLGLEQEQVGPEQVVVAVVELVREPALERVEEVAGVEVVEALAVAAVELAPDQAEAAEQALGQVRVAGPEQVRVEVDPGVAPVGEPVQAVEPVQLTVVRAARPPRVRVTGSARGMHPA